MSGYNPQKVLDAKSMGIRDQSPEGTGLKVGLGTSIGMRHNKKIKTTSYGSMNQLQEKRNLALEAWLEKKSRAILPVESSLPKPKPKPPPAPGGGGCMIL